MTGGADRKVKVWEKVNGMSKLSFSSEIEIRNTFVFVCINPNAILTCIAPVGGTVV